MHNNNGRRFRKSKERRVSVRPTTRTRSLGMSEENVFSSDMKRTHSLLVSVRPTTRTRSLGMSEENVFSSVPHTPCVCVCE